LKCGKGDQKSDERVLNRPAAPPVLFQAAEVFEGQRFTTDRVHMSPDDWLVVSYRGADAEAVTRITAFALSFVCVGLATAFELPG
jgi:hypothetical protein